MAGRWASCQLRVTGILRVVKNRLNQGPGGATTDDRPARVTSVAPGQGVATSGGPLETPVLGSPSQAASTWRSDGRGQQVSERDVQLNRPGNPDVVRAKSFNGGLFGWQMKDVPSDCAGTYSMCRLRGKDVAGMHAHSSEEGTDWSSYISVADVDKSTSKAGGLGASFVMEPFEIPGRLRSATSPRRISWPCPRTAPWKRPSRSCETRPCAGRDHRREPARGHRLHWRSGHRAGFGLRPGGHQQGPTRPLGLEPGQLTQAVILRSSHCVVTRSQLPAQQGSLPWQTPRFACPRRGPART